MKANLTEFITSLRGPTGAPGGGAASAVAGAMGCALYQMVAGVTLSLPRFTEGRDRLAEIEEQSKTLCDRFQDLSAKDTDSYIAVENAMKLPRATTEEKAARRQAMQAAFKVATLVPLETIEVSCLALSVLPDLIKYGNPNAITDIAVGTELLLAARKGASMNAEINLGSIKDSEFIESAQNRLVESVACADSVVPALIEAARAAGVTF